MRPEVVTIQLDAVHGADYNPRFLSDDAKDNLRESISALGFCLPILVNRENNTIVAGHQRTKVARLMGITEVPGFYVSAVTKGDEVYFNQLHNELERNSMRIKVKDLPETYGKFITIPSKNFDVTNENSNPRNVFGISQLLLRYGNVFCTIIADNECIYYQDYVAACYKLGYDVNYYIAPPEKADKFKEMFVKDYGIYDYSNLEKNTWVQGKAQMHRSTKENATADKKRNASQTYERMVLKHPNLANKSLLDFGCGEAEYVNWLREKGYDAIGVEFYNYTGNASLNIAHTLRQIKVLENHLKTARFDVVVCDSVLNSTNCNEAEDSVMGCLMAFCKKDGDIYFSGRSYPEIKFDAAINKMSEIRFLDDDGYTGQLRGGEWYFQKYHTKNQVLEIAKKFNLKIIDFEYEHSTWRVHAKKSAEPADDTTKKAIEYEFSLPYPGGRYKRAGKILEAMRDGRDNRQDY